MIGGLFNRRYEAITAARKGLDVAWLLGIIAQGCPKPLDAEVQTLFEIDEGIATPQFLLDFIARDQITGATGEQGQDLEGLRWNRNRLAILAQFASLQVRLEGSKAKDSCAGVSDIHIDRLEGGG